MAMKLVIRQSSGDQFEVEVPTTATVLELKQACEKTVNLAPEAQRLIFKGKPNFNHSFAFRPHFEGRANTRIAQD
jgi:hypothetical protein